MILNIELSDIENYEEISFRNIHENNCLELKVVVPFNQNVYEYLSSSNAFKEAINHYIEFLYKENDMDQIKKVFKLYKCDNLNNLFDYIIFDGNIDLIYNYIIKNNLNNKKIVYNLFDYSTENIKQLKEKIVNPKKTYINISGNRNFITLSKYKKITHYLESIVNKVDEYEFSPLEKIIYIYDIVRDRYFKFSNNSEDKSYSRDLEHVLFEDEIVCEGFVNIFNELLHKLNFNVNKIFLNRINNLNIGHVRSIVYLKDDKYAIDGIFLFDPTFDSRKSENNDFFNQYTFFCKNLSYFFEYNKDKYVNKLKYLENFYSLFKEEKETKKIYEMDYELIKTINFLSRLIYQDDLLSSLMLNITNKTLDEVEKISELLDKKVSEEMLWESIKTVRYKQCIESPQKFSISQTNFDNIKYNIKYPKYIRKRTK